MTGFPYSAFRGNEHFYSQNYADFTDNWLLFYAVIPNYQQ